MSPLEPMKINSGSFTGGTWDAATLSAINGVMQKWCDAKDAKALKDGGFLRLKLPQREQIGDAEHLVASVDPALPEAGGS